MPRLAIRRGNVLVPTLWVDAATGDDSRSKATVAASGGSLPWATIGRAAWGSTNRAAPNAAEAADAGDVVLVAAGAYDYTGSLAAEDANRFAVLYNPVNSGTVSAPVTFYATSTVTLTAGNLEAPVIGASGVDYVRWWGPFSVDEATSLQTPDTGLVVLANTTGSVVRGCSIQGIWVDYNDNNPGVRLENAHACTVSYNTIDGFRKSQVTGSPNHNGCGVQLYGCTNCLIERNTITDCHSGVFFKDLNGTGPQYGTVVRFNKIDGCNEGITNTQVSAGSTEGRHYVYQNLILNGDFGFYVGGATDDHWTHNTVVNMTSAGLYINSVSFVTGMRVWNNIFEDCATMVYVGGAAMPAASLLSAQHNLHHTYTTFYTGSDGNRTRASYLAAFTDQDMDSAEADPLFINAAAGNYRLAEGSPAATLGYALDGIGGTEGTAVPAGCYLTGAETMGVA